MKETVQVLMTRDGLSREEAVKQVKDFFFSMREDIEQGGDPFAWEEEFSSEFGLEPDFFEDFIFSLAI